jgi:predicted anti-sigma-YlaC factor YlaD
MMNCKQATELMSQELERSLSWSERMALRFHLMMCSGCTNFRRQMAFIRDACRLRSQSEE